MNRRLEKDIKTMLGDEMASLGIYYTVDESDMRRGFTLIFGPEDSRYANCPLLFSVEYPLDYPISPPIVRILTSDGHTRFHPNLYIEGKVCLSILGTYPGPSWVSSMNIGSVFKSIISLLDNNPIVNEPGWESYNEKHPAAKAYADFVEFHLVKHTLKEYEKYRDGKNTLWSHFSDTFEQFWPNHLEKIQNRLKLKALDEPNHCTNILYGMQGTIHWAKLLPRT
jgi:ubiquitin-conjugating enzyme E2 Z